MPSVPTTTSTSASAAASTGNGVTRGNDLREVDLDQFLKLMIAELQNQDPLNPMDNAQMVQQISTIRQIGSTNQLTETLESVLVGQNITTASSLIGREVKALADDATEIQGVVERVSVARTTEAGQEKQDLRVYVGDRSFRLNNIREIVEQGA